MTLLIAYDRIAATIEARERAAGVQVGSWRWANAEAWSAAIRFGLRRNVALDEREQRRANGGRS